MNNILLFIGTLLVVALAALFAVPHFIDWNVYRSGFETQASNLIGRDVRVGGRVNLRLLPAPFVSFENVRVADHEGRFSEPPLRVEAFTLWLSIPPLLRGAIEASEVDLRRPEFLVRMLAPAVGTSGPAATPVPTLPVSVALRSVNIHDGIVRVIDSADTETLRIEKITGEFSAPSLEGPYRFRGGLQHGDRLRDVRIATGRLEADGGLTFDGSVRFAEQGSIYQGKGRIAALLTDPTFIGELSVQPSPDRTGKGKQAGKDDDIPFYEIKSRLRLSLRDARFDDLTVLFEQAGRPQMMSGSASATFGDDRTFSAALQARWLDLDQIAGVPGKGGPYAGLVRLATLAQTWLPSGGSTNVRLGIEQATLGADTVNGIDIALGQGKESLELTRLSADAPGGARIRLSGAIGGLSSAPRGPAAGNARAGSIDAAPASSTTSTGEAMTFGGPFQIHGQNLNRFLAWAAAGSAPLMQDGAGAFALSAILSLGRGKVGISRMRGELGSSSFEGDASIGLGSPGAASRPDLTLAIDSDRLDLRPVLSGTAKLADVWRRLQADSSQAALKPQTGAAVPAGLTELLLSINSEIRLRVGRLMLPELELRDLDADLGRTEASTAVRTMKFTTGSGLKVQIDGHLQTGEGKQRGALKTVVEMEQPAALVALLRFVDLPEAQALETRAASLMPLRLAGIVTVGARGGGGFELLLDGAAQDTRTSLVVRGDQELAGWRTGAIDVTGMLENTKSSHLLAQLLPGIAPPSQGAGEQGRISIRANGLPKTGISAAIELESRAVEAGFSGVITLPGDQPTMSGEIGLKSADVADSLRLVGLRGVRALQGRDLVLHARVSAKGDSIEVADAALRLGSASAEANGRILRRDGRLDIDLKAKASNASLPALLAIALGTGQGAAPAAGNINSSGQSIWADEAIDLAGIGEIGGKVRLNSDTLSIGQSMTLRHATLDLEVTPTAVEVKGLTGEALGGRVIVNARAEKSQSGIALTGTAKIDGAQLDRIAVYLGAAPGASGTASGTMAFSGGGLTPRGVIGTLSGTGNLQLKDARLSRFGAEALEAAVAKALDPTADEPAAQVKEPGETKNDASKFDVSALKSLIAAQLSKTPLVIGSRTIPLEILDGALRSKTLAFDVPRGRVTAANYLDLTALTLDSEWTIATLGRFEARGKPTNTKAVKADSGTAADATGGAFQIPSISVVLAGPLTELSRLTPQINAEALSRELLVRRMERDVDLLERARKQREEDEALRQKQREMDKEQTERLRTEPGRKEGLETGKAQATPANALPGAASAPPGRPSPADGAPGGSSAARSPPPIPVPAPVPLSPQTANQPTPPGAPPALTGETAPRSATPPSATPRPRQDSPASLPPKISRPPSVFDQSRGL